MLQELRRFVGVFGLFTCVASASAVAQGAPRYQVTDLGTLFENTAYVHLNDINNRGEIVGDAWRVGPDDGPLGHTVGFVYAAGQVHDFTPPFVETDLHVNANRINDQGVIVGSIGTYEQQPFVYANGVLATVQAPSPGIGGEGNAAGINNTGQIVGAWYLRNGMGSLSFLYDNGQTKDLGTLGAKGWAEATSINNAGQIVGSAGTPDGEHAFLYRNGVMTDLGTFGGAHSTATDINDAGIIVGQAEKGDGGYHAFLYKDAQMIDLDTFGANMSFASRINARGEVIGAYVIGYNTLVPFYYSQATGSVKLDTLLDPASGWTMTQVSDINDAGQIIGLARQGDREMPVLLTPVPELSTLSLYSMGMMMLAGMAYMRRRATLRTTSKARSA